MSSFNKIANSDIFKKSYIQDELTKFFYIKNQTKAAEQKLAKNSEINAAHKKLLEFDTDFEKFYYFNDLKVLLIIGRGGGIPTHNLVIQNHLLWQLSYAPIYLYI